MKLTRIALSCVVKEVEGEDRMLDFIASDETEDRHDTVIDMKGWELDNFRRNPVVLLNHNYTGLPVARGNKIWKSKGQLKIRAEFPSADISPEADTVFKLSKAGYMKAVSVGFIPLASRFEYVDEKGNVVEDDKADTNKHRMRRRFTHQELLEVSIVTVPSNPNALQDAVKNSVITEEEANTFAVHEDLIEPDVTLTMAMHYPEGVHEAHMPVKDEPDPAAVATKKMDDFTLILVKFIADTGKTLTAFEERLQIIEANSGTSDPSRPAPEDDPSKPVYEELLAPLRGISERLAALRKTATGKED